MTLCALCDFMLNKGFFRHFLKASYISVLVCSKAFFKSKIKPINMKVSEIKKIPYTQVKRPVKLLKLINLI